MPLNPKEWLAPDVVHSKTVLLARRMADEFLPDQPDSYFKFFVPVLGCDLVRFEVTYQINQTLGGDGELIIGGKEPLPCPICVVNEALLELA